MCLSAPFDVVPAQVSTVCSEIVCVHMCPCAPHLVTHQIRSLWLKFIGRCMPTTSAGLATMWADVEAELAEHFAESGRATESADEASLGAEGQPAFETQAARSRPLVERLQQAWFAAVSWASGGPPAGLGHEQKHGALVALASEPEERHASHLVSRAGVGDLAFRCDAGLSDGVWSLARVLDDARGDHDALLEQDDASKQALEDILRGEGAIISKTAEAARLGVSIMKLDALKYRCAMLSLLCERAEVLRIMQEVCADVISSGGRCICLSWHARYDETPLRFRMVDGQSFAALSNLAESVGVAGAVIPGAFQDSVPHKVLQSETSVSMLVQLGCGTFMHMTFPCVVWLQALDSTKGSCYWRAVQDWEVQCGTIAKHFERTQRLSSTDGDAAVAKAERAFAMKYEGLHLLHVGCQVHLCAGIRKKSMSLDDPLITAVIHTCLALGFSNNMGNFREDLREVLVEMLDYRVGKAPVEFRATQDAWLSTFCGGNDRASELRRAILGTMANGDIRGERFTHFCDGCCKSKEDCEWKLRTWVVAALAGVVPKPFPRSRWTDQEISLNFVGLLEGCNRLFTKTFDRFSRRYQRVAEPRVRPASGLGPLCGSAPGHATEDGHPRDGAGFDVGLGGDAEAQLPNSGPDAPDTSAEGWEQKQQEQSNYRRTVLAWVGGDGPLGRLVVVRVAVEMLRKFTQSLLFLGGDKWEQDQHDIERKAEAARPEEGLPGRSFRVVIAASATVEHQIHEKIQKAWTSASTWEAVPDISRTEQLQSYAFRIGSRMMCLTHELACSNSAYPFRLFLLLSDASFEETVMQERCRWCPWTSQFVQKYSAEGLRCPAALCDLQGTAELLRLDTSQIEALHATLRRGTVALGCQTHSLGFLDASATMVLRKFKRFRTKFYKHFGEAQATLKKDADQAAASLPKRGGGGPWRAFIACFTDEHPEGSPNFHELGKMYAALTDDERDFYERLGEQGTRRHREGEIHPFGMPKVARQRAERRRMVGNAAAALLDARAGLDPESADAFAKGQAEALVSERTSAQVGSAWSKVLMVRTQCALASKVKKAADDHNALAWERFDQSQGKRIRDVVAVAVPSIGDKVHDFRVVPSGGCFASTPIVRLLWEPVRAVHQAAQLAALPATSKLAKRLFPRVHEAWCRLHAKVPSDPAAEVQDKPKASARDVCKLARLCVCKRPQKWRFEAIVKNMRVAFRRAMAMERCKQAILDAKVVVALIGRKEQDCGGAKSGLSLVADQRGARVEKVSFLHLGHLSLKPWAPSWQELHGSGIVVCDLGSLFDAPIALVGTCRCLTTPEAIVELDIKLRWDMVFFKNVESDRLVGDFNAMSICVAPLGAHESHMLWDPFSKRDRKRKQRTWDFDLEVSSGSDGEMQNRGGIDEEAPDWAVALEEIIDEDEGVSSSSSESEASYGGDHGQEEGASEGANPKSDEGMLVAAIEEGQAEVAGAAVAQEEQAMVAAAMVEPSRPPALARALPAAGNLRVCVGLGNSYIAHYERPKQFYAVCLHAGHEKCRLTRTSNPGAQPASGRPLGYLMAWLDAAASYDDAFDHRQRCLPTCGDRRAARSRLHGVSGSGDVFARERPRRQDTDSEPEELA